MCRGVSRQRRFRKCPHPCPWQIAPGSSVCAWKTQRSDVEARSRGEGGCRCPGVWTQRVEGLFHLLARRRTACTLSCRGRSQVDAWGRLAILGRPLTLISELLSLGSESRRCPSISLGNEILKTGVSFPLGRTLNCQ